MPPKAHLRNDGQLYFEYQLARELHKTHRELLGTLGSGEIAYWRAVFSLENDRYANMRADAENKAKADQLTAGVLQRGIYSRTPDPSPG